jgi:hypothetical protein
MNELIQNIAKQANVEFTYDPTEVPIKAFVECWEDELVKFAELIVKELAAEAHRRVCVEGNDCNIYTHLIQHFGFQE